MCPAAWPPGPAQHGAHVASAALRWHLRARSGCRAPRRQRSRWQLPAGIHSQRCACVASTSASAGTCPLLGMHAGLHACMSNALCVWDCALQRPVQEWLEAHRLRGIQLKEDRIVFMEALCHTQAVAAAQAQRWATRPGAGRPHPVALFPLPCTARLLRLPRPAQAHSRGRPSLSSSSSSTSLAALLLQAGALQHRRHSTAAQVLQLTARAAAGQAAAKMMQRRQTASPCCGLRRSETSTAGTIDFPTLADCLTQHCSVWRTIVLCMLLCVSHQTAAAVIWRFPVRGLNVSLGSVNGEWLEAFSEWILGLTCPLQTKSCVLRFACPAQQHCARSRVFKDKA